MSKRSANCLEAGAIIDDEMGTMNMNADMLMITSHFCLKVQLRVMENKVMRRQQGEGNVEAYFLGFSGSSGPSQSMVRALSSLAWALFGERIVWPSAEVILLE
jgi:hypothetical protein